MRWTGVTIDCCDPDALARFWSAVLSRPMTDEMDGPGWATVGSRHDALPRLTFQKVREPKLAKVRLHLDLTVDDIALASARVVAFGGSATGQRCEHDEGVVVVMSDLEGNEFCLVQYF